MFQPTTECVDSLTIDDLTGQAVPESGTGLWNLVIGNHQPASPIASQMMTTMLCNNNHTSRLAVPPPTLPFPCYDPNYIGSKSCRQALHGTARHDHAINWISCQCVVTAAKTDSASLSHVRAVRLRDFLGTCESAVCVRIESRIESAILYNIPHFLIWLIYSFGFG